MRCKKLCSSTLSALTALALIVSAQSQVNAADLNEIKKVPTPENNLSEEIDFKNLLNNSHCTPMEYNDFIPYTTDNGNILVDSEKIYQQFEGWGTSLCWWGNAIGRWQGSKKQEIIDLLFDEEKGLGLNIVRYNIGGGVNPNEIQKMRTYADIPSFQPEPGQWNLDADKYQREILTSAIAKGVNITEAFSNGPPYWMTYTKSAAGSLLGFTNNLYNDAYDDFANYIVRVLKLYKEKYGIEFRTFAPLNEPGDHWWRKGNNQEGCHFDRDKQNLLLKEVASRLRENGILSTQISANEEASFEKAAKSFLACDDYVKGELAQINVHSYFGSNRMWLRKVAAEAGKRLWVSECGVGTGAHDHDEIDSSMLLTRKILWDLKDLSANAWLYWQAVEDEAGKNNWGFVHANFTGDEEYWLTKQYYTMMNYTKFIRPGCQIIQIDDNDTLGAYDPQKKRLIMVITNDSSSYSNKRYSLTGFSSLSDKITYNIRTSASENAKAVSSAILSDNILTVELPSRSVTTVVIEQCRTDSLLKINDSREGILKNHYSYNGNWKSAAQSGAFDSDNHWSNDNQASYSISFTGKQIALYGAKDYNNGIAGIYIDDKFITDADLYSPKREEGACYFDSGLLPEGEHKITVHVTGRKSEASRGTYITADYARINGNMQTILPNREETPLQGNSLILGIPAHIQGQENSSTENLTDGRQDTGFSVESGKKIIFPLQSLADISEIQVFASNNMSYVIQASSDGENYTDIAFHKSAQTDNGYFRAILSAPVKASSIALYCGPNSNNQHEFTEVKVFGSGYKNINDNTVGEQDSFMYSGNWQYYWFDNNAYLKDNHYSNQTGDSCTLHFSGSKITLYGAKDKNHGMAKVLLDGEAKGVIDYYSPSRIDNVSVFETDGLTPGEHTLEIEVLETKNPLSSGNFVTIDHAVYITK